jgi:hypothetical protein
MDDDDYYGPNHITDLLTAHTYTNAHMTGKHSQMVYLAAREMTVVRPYSRSEWWTTYVAGGTIFTRRDVLRQFGFLRRRSRVDSTLFERFIPRRGNLYVTHSLEFLLHRHDSGHTWRRKDDEFLATSLTASPGIDASMLDTSGAEEDPRP